MKRIRFATSVASAALFVAFSSLQAQQSGSQASPEKPASKPAAKPADAQGGQAKLGAAKASAIRSAIERLASSDFDTRRSAADELAARGKDALPFLEKAIRASEDAELRWQARRVVRRIESGASKRVRELEAQERKAAPRREGAKLGRVRRGDSSPRRGRARGLDVDDFPGIDPRFAERLRQRINEMLPRGGGMGFRFDPNMQGSTGSSLSVRIDENGVRVEESTTEDGKEKKKVYEAPDMKTLLKEHPELKGRVGTAPRVRIDGLRDIPGIGKLPGFGGMGFGRDFDTRFGRDMQKQIEDMRKQMQQMQNRLRSQLGRRGFDFDIDGRRDSSSSEERDARTPARERPVEAKGPTLGIYIRDEIPAAIRSYLDLEEGVGLWIESVVDGSIADKSGLQAGDIVTKIGSKEIRSAADVRASLLVKGELRVDFIRKGAKKSAAVKGR